MTLEETKFGPRRGQRQHFLLGLVAVLVAVPVALVEVLVVILAVVLVAESVVQKVTPDPLVAGLTLEPGSDPRPL